MSNEDAKLAVLEERTTATLDAIHRIEGKLDECHKDHEDRIRNLEGRGVGTHAVTGGAGVGVGAAILYALHWIINSKPQ